MSHRKKSALVLGATGLVGKELVKILWEQNQYEKIRVLTRRPVKMKGQVCEPHIIDFEELQIHSDLFGVTDVFCCLGTTIKKAKTKEAFRKVDYEYPVMAAKLAKDQGAEKFLIITAMGANSNSTFFYNRVKGDVEDSLRNLNLPALHIFRPSLLLGNREEFRFGEKLAEKASGFLNALMLGPLRPYRGIHTSKVAAAMAAVADSNKNGTNIYLSHEIEQIAASFYYNNISKR